jgi:integrase
VEKAHLAQASRHNLLRMTKKVFNALIREGSFVGPNPAVQAKPVPLTKKQAQRHVWIPYDHFVLLLNASEKSASPINLHDMLELNWEVAFRMDEMLTLEWTQIDLERRLISIIEKPNFPTRFGLGWAPKWHQERTITLTDKAIEVIKRQPKRVTAGPIGETSQLAPTTLVFPKRAFWGREVKYLRCDSIKKAWRTTVERAGLKPFGYQWHDVRRSWNRLAAERGIPVAYRAAFLGHREEVNEDNYETEMAVRFMLERMGQSMAPGGHDPSNAVPDLFQLPVGNHTHRRK